MRQGQEGNRYVIKYVIKPTYCESLEFWRTLGDNEGHISEISKQGTRKREYLSLNILLAIG